MPFAIDSNGSISITETLSDEMYQFDVVAVDCDRSGTSLEKISEPARVTVKMIKSCKPTITGRKKKRRRISHSLSSLCRQQPDEINDSIGSYAYL